MMSLELTAAFTPNPLTAPLLERAVVPAHITWAPKSVGLEQHPEIAADIYGTFNRAHDKSIAPYGVQANQQARRRIWLSIWMLVPTFKLSTIFHVGMLAIGKEFSTRLCVENALQLPL